MELKRFIRSYSVSTNIGNKMVKKNETHEILNISQNK